MEFPRWLDLLLFVLACIVALVKIRYIVKTYQARDHIYGGNKQFMSLGITANIGYVLSALLLGVYFLLLYFGSGSAQYLFYLAALILLVVVAIELGYLQRKR